MSYQQLAEKLNVSKSRVFYQCKILREQNILNDKVKRYTWTFEQEKELINLLNLNMSVSEISKILNKDQFKVVAKISYLKNNNIIDNSYIPHLNINYNNCNLTLSNWTNEDIDNLIFNIKDMGLLKLSEKLNKSTFDVIMKYYELSENIKIETYYNCKNYTQWTKEMDLFLINNFSNGMKEYIMNNLSKFTWKQIIARAKLFGLTRNQSGTLYISPNEKIVKQILKELNIDYYFQKHIYYKKNKYFIADFLIKDTNIILEAQGDYWHGNPQIFKNPSDIQLEKIKNDKIRKKILENLNYKVIYLWEYDLVNNYEQCKLDIIKALPPG